MSILQEIIEKVKKSRAIKYVEHSIYETNSILFVVGDTKKGVAKIAKALVALSNDEISVSAKVNCVSTVDDKSYITVSNILVKTNENKAQVEATILDN